MSNEIFNPPNGPVEGLINLIIQEGTKFCNFSLVAQIVEDFLKSIEKFFFR